MIRIRGSMTTLRELLKAEEPEVLTKPSGDAVQSGQIVEKPGEKPSFDSEEMGLVD